MADSNTKLKKLEDALEDIVAAGDAARLQLHLLSMRARERTGGISASIESLEQRLDRGIDQAMQVATNKTRELTSTVREALMGNHADVNAELRVRNIMSGAVRSCSASDTLNTAAQIMWEHDCGAVPVVNAEGQLCGIVTDRDLCMAAYTRGQPLSSLRIGDVMARPVHVCRPDDSIERVATLMAEAQVRRLAVVDEERRPMGMIALADLAFGAAALRRQGPALVYRLLQAVSKPRRNQPGRGLPAAAE